MFELTVRGEGVRFNQSGRDMAASTRGSCHVVPAGRKWGAIAAGAQLPFSFLSGLGPPAHGMGLPASTKLS